MPASLPCTVHGHPPPPQLTLHAPAAWGVEGWRRAWFLRAWFSLLLAALRLLTWATPDLHTRQPLRRSRQNAKKETPRAKNINTESARR